MLSCAEKVGKGKKPVNTIRKLAGIGISGVSCTAILRQMMTANLLCAVQDMEKYRNGRRSG